MKIITTSRLTALASVLALGGFSLSSNASTIIFQDNFEDTTAFASGDTFTTKQNALNAGVATGSWTVATGSNSKLGTDGTNSAFVTDGNNYDITSTFSQAGAVGTNATTIQFDFAVVRENGNKRTSFIGLQGATALFTLNVIAPGNDALRPDPSINGGVWVTTDPNWPIDTEVNTIGYNQGGLSAGNLVNDYLRTMTITLSATSFDAWVDINGDGIVDAGEQLSGLAYTNNPTTGITGMQILGAASPTNIGVAIDNYLVTTVPEPSAAFLVGLGMLALLRRR